MEHGDSAWVYWVPSQGWSTRGTGRDGRSTMTRLLWAIAFVDRMREWFTLRVIMSEHGPLAGTLSEILEHATEEYQRQQSTGVDELEPTEEPDET